MNRWLTIVLVIGLAGCARFHSQPLSPAGMATSLDARRLDDPGFRRFAEANLSRSFPEWPPKAWDFDLLTLAAMYYHPALDVARAQWGTALGGDKTAAGRLNPTLSAVPGYDFSSIPPLSPWIPAVSLDVPIETAGKRGYRIAHARHLTDAARLNIITTAWQVRSNLRTSLIDWSDARQREVLLQQQYAVQEKIVQSFQQRMDAGAASSVELGVVRIALQRIELELLRARRLSVAARIRVADAIGISVTALEGVELPGELFANTSPEGLTSVEVRRWALQSRADILGALAEYDATQSVLQLEIARQYPDIHLSPGYQFDQGDNKFTFGITAELPLLNQNQGPIAEAKARRTEVAARFEALQAKVITEIDGAVAAYRVSREELATLESLAATQRKQAAAVEQQEEVGEAEPLDLLNSRLESGASELAILDGRLRLQQALGALEDAMQRPIATLNPALIEQSRRPQPLKEKQP